jgi:phospholipid-transporting ATPase
VTPPLEQEGEADIVRRIIAFNESLPLKPKYCSNRVNSAKYTWYTWAPKSLLMQFRRAANIYFLIISILTSFPFSPKNPISLLGTFGAVLVFTMLKELYEDYYRHKADNEVNEALTLVYDKSERKFKEKQA